MPRLFDHVDLRVNDLAVAGLFYRQLLPLLGFTVSVDIPGWIQFEAPGAGAAEFFGVTEDKTHRPNHSRIAFWAESVERVNELAAKLDALGAQKIEGPSFESATYYAVYFDDPSGNPLEIVHRTQRFE
ncbi:VOC family protein [Oleiharenicola lentus]|uniref:VOC family protein n=1 Tax=Oleiharenicola lentus TaxID=2508720 RepID=UPI003F670ACC